MAQFNIHEAKTGLSSLLQRAAAGEEIVIARDGEPVAKLVAIQRKRRRAFGLDRGRVEIAEDFDAPLSPELLATFER